MCGWWVEDTGHVVRRLDWPGLYCIALRSVQLMLCWVQVDDDALDQASSVDLYAYNARPWACVSSR